jgi:hypothetical protein
MAEQKPRGGLGGLKDLIESNFGKPTEAIHSLTELSNAIASIDQAKLREIKGMLGSMGNVQMDVEQLRLVVELVKEFCTLDIAKLKEVKGLMGSMGKADLNVDQLRLVVELLKLFCTLDIEKLKEAGKLIANVTQLVNKLPKDLPVGEIVGSLKELKG